MSDSTPPVYATEEALAQVAGSVDTFYFIFCGALVFFMQAGFGMLEAGSVRTKNTRNILLKNLLDACVGALIWWAWGFATAGRAPPPPPSHPRRMSCRACSKW